ncbi:MAG: hypothetical protein ACRYHQ_14635 [Janthinobacterium lividum]
MWLAQCGVVSSYAEALALTPTMRLALMIISGRNRGDQGKWNWRDRDWDRPAQ